MLSPFLLACFSTVTIMSPLVATTFDSDYYLGCFLKPTGSFNPAMREDAIDSILLPQPNAHDCVTFCNLNATAQNTYTYVGLEYSGMCYCFNNLFSYHTRLEDSYCDMPCGMLSEGEICREFNTFKVYVTCPKGLFGPPMCQGICPFYCYNETEKYCLFDGLCAFGCVDGICATVLTPQCDTLKGAPNYEVLSLAANDMDEMELQSYILKRLTFLKPGVIRQISVYGRPEGKAYVSIWRPQSQKNQYLLRRKYELDLSRQSIYRISGDQMKPNLIVGPGDVVGVHLDATVKTRTAKLSVYSDQREFTVFYGTDKGSLGAGSAFVFTPDNTYDNGSWVANQFVVTVMPTTVLYTVAIEVNIDCTCPFNCNGAICDQFFRCTGGCSPGFRGTYCDMTCLAGAYGADCKLKCHNNCINSECDGTTGSCKQGCTPGFYGPYCDLHCQPGFYGQSCNHMCSMQCLQKDGLRPCDVVTGVCVYGCQAGYIGMLCDRTCPIGTYGYNCNETCRNCIQGNTCDHLGACPSGCVSNYIPPLCKYSEGNCMPGNYGPACSLTCGLCKDGAICDVVSGACPSGCQDGYNEPLCQQSCKSGMFGRNCSISCGHCLYISTQTCNFVDGTCVDGCMVGYQAPPLCMLGNCYPNYYGDGCKNRCGSCKDNDCSPFTGECLSGCSPGYIGSICNDSCAMGYWGEGCRQTCGQCLDSDLCDYITGYCPSGCMAGWTPPLCLQPCSQGFYGNCSTPCGSCKDPTCATDTGFCHLGCNGNFAPPLCQTCAGAYGPSCEFICGKCKGSLTCSRDDGTCQFGCQDGYLPPLCNQPCLQGFYGTNCSLSCGRCAVGTTCDPTYHLCPKGCLPGFAAPLCQQCQFGYYGEDCTYTIGKCLTQSYDNMTGICIDGCTGNYLPPICQTCKNGFWGFNCDQVCPGTCSDGMPCRPDDGFCVSDCARENIDLSPDCSIGKAKDCFPGYYGSKCTLRCGQCRQNTVCDPTTGHCDSGCQPNYFPPMCQQCVSGFYGIQCLYTCGQCANGEPCSSTTGNCPGACTSATLTPPYCKAVPGQMQLQPDCPSGYYGAQCEKQCGRCLSGAQCLPTGSCPGDCDVGYTPPFCVQQCQPGFYGKACKIACGYCITRDSCDVTTGKCTKGCLAGYIGDDCQSTTSNIAKQMQEPPGASGANRIYLFEATVSILLFIWSFVVLHNI